MTSPHPLEFPGRNRSVPARFPRSSCPRLREPLLKRPSQVLRTYCIGTRYRHSSPRRYYYFGGSATLIDARKRELLYAQRNQTFRCIHIFPSDIMFNAGLYFTYLKSTRSCTCNNSIYVNVQVLGYSSTQDSPAPDIRSF